MTGNAQSEDRVSRLTAERETNRVLWRLVRSLEVAFHISPHDTALVDAVGAGTEHSNHEALFTWVSRELGHPGGELAAGLLPELTGRLERALRRWELEHH